MWNRYGGGYIKLINIFVDVKNHPLLKMNTLHSCKQWYPKDDP